VIFGSKFTKKPLVAGLRWGAYSAPPDSLAGFRWWGPGKGTGKGEERRG